MRDFETVEDAEWKRFYHGVIEEDEFDQESMRVSAQGAERGFSADPDEDGPRCEEREAEEYVGGIHTAMSCEPCEMLAHGMFNENDKYFVVPWKDIEEEMKMEEESKAFVSHSTVVGASVKKMYLDLKGMGPFLSALRRLRR